MVICEVCKKSYKSISGRHLKTHQLTTDEYRSKYPNAITHTNILVDLACSVCGNIFQGNSNISKSLAVCNDCRDKGHKMKNITKEIIRKREETLFNKTGYKNPSSDPSIKERKRNKELLKSNGLYDCPFKDPNIKKKIVNTCLRKYGVSSPMKVTEVKNKLKETLLKKYGVDSPLKNKDILSKMIKTSNANGGIGTANPRINEKIKSTTLKLYGVENYSKTEEYKTKYKKTCIERYGYNHPSKVEEFRLKINNTFKKYQGGHPLKDPEVRKKINETIRKNYVPKLLKYLKILDIILIDREYISSSHLHTWKCLKCNVVFKQTWFNIEQTSKCLNCSPDLTGKSIMESQIFKFVDGIVNEYIFSNSRKIIYPKELDIYIPSKKIAIEFNGLYWHSEDILECAKTYHLKKTELCSELGIQLVHIFEDEWLFKKEIVKSRLSNLLGSFTKRIYARKCIIREIDPRTKNEFLVDNHIQGKDNSSIKLGAFHQDELVSVMTFSKGNISKGSKTKEGVWELNRFCSKLGYQVVGVAGKLLTNFKRNYEWKEIFSYADRRWSEGGVYYKLGFKLDHITTPNYWYIKDFTRLHRFNFRKRPDEPKDIPEWVLRKKEGLTRIWDCGNLKFTMINGNL